MSLIENDHRVGTQHRVTLDLGQQDAVRHELDLRVAACVIAETHLAADLAAPAHIEFLSDPV